MRSHPTCIEVFQVDILTPDQKRLVDVRSGDKSIIEETEVQNSLLYIIWGGEGG